MELVIAVISGVLTRSEILSTLSREFPSHKLPGLILGLSWSHHALICPASDRSDRQYFYFGTAVRERWSFRELQRQLDSDLFTRYVCVKRDPEKCLPADTEQGDLLPFKDHYVLDLLGLEDSHTERQLRKAMLANLRDLSLELGRDFTLVGEEHPLTVGDDTFRVDLLLFHRRLQCLVVVELKSGKFKPEYVGKCQLDLAALDALVRLAHEKPSIGLILCKSADSVRMRLAADRRGPQIRCLYVSDCAAARGPGSAAAEAAARTVGGRAVNFTVDGLRLRLSSAGILSSPIA
jgi:predicted nuclease of restriction endonuclease-like (RecB) superfamily